jgi:Uma2 family endonuclease
MGATSTPLLSAEELLLRPNDGLLHELVRGELRSMTPAGSEHGAIGAWLLGRMARCVQDQQLGRLFNSDTGFLIASSPDTVRSPHVAFLGGDRGRASLPPGYYPGAPDLAVEVVSPHDRLDEVEEKVQDWLRAGRREVWVVSPRLKTVAVHRAPSDIQVLTSQDTLESPELLPGFACRVAEVFGA